jgi:endonuclease/exonuclease/phosphatase family metal-dependent hydrolase
MVAALFLLGAYGYWFNPEKYWFIGLLTLANFYFLLLLLGFFFFWLLAKPKMIFISLAAMVLAWSPLRQLVKLRLNTGFELKKEKSHLRVMSWNIEHFEIASYKKNPEKKQQMLQLVNAYSPDVACFQEMVGNENNPAAINYLPDIAATLNMPFYFYAYNPKLSYDKNHQFGILIFSKYPFIKKEMISRKPNNYNSIFQYVDIAIGRDTVRIFNLHLQSLQFSNEDLKYLEEPSIDNESSFKNSKNIISKFKTGFAKRRLQSIRVKEEMNKSPFPLVVCGDFNDVPNSFAYHHIGSGLQNGFATAGTGIGRTYSHIAPTLRIDNIFVDQRFTIHQFTRDGKKISDHFPIIADLELN